MKCPFCGTVIEEGYTVCKGCRAVYKNQFLPLQGILFFILFMTTAISLMVTFNARNSTTSMISLIVAIVGAIGVYYSMKHGIQKVWVRPR